MTDHCSFLLNKWTLSLMGYFSTHQWGIGLEGPKWIIYSEETYFLLPFFYFR